MNEIEILDSEVRKEAVTTSHHAFVWASAGTGKTHTLTLRAVFLLFHLSEEKLFLSSSKKERLQAASDVLRSVVLTTFTRKAAAEMQTRLFRYLDVLVAAKSFQELENSLTQADPLFVEIVEQAANRLPSGSLGSLQKGTEALMERFSELQISTIHSFATSILRRHPMENKLPPNCQFAREDEDDIVDLEERILEAWWRTEALLDPGIRDDLRRVLEVAEIREVQIWLEHVFKNPWILEECSACSEYAPRELNRALRALKALSASVHRKGSRLVREFHKLDTLLAEIEEKPGALVPLAAFLTEQKDYIFPDGDSPQAIRRAVQRVPEELRQYLQSYYSIYPLVLASILKNEFREAWSAWQRLLESFVNWTRIGPSRTLGIVTFDDMIRLAVELLEDFPRIRKEENSRLRALLVDEFQDTDRMQLRLLELLLANDPTSKREETTGFFVGDIKQSIYRFRGADVSSVERFFECYEERTGCRLPKSQYRLQTSFRSLKPVTEFVNRFFSENLRLAGEDEFLIPARPYGEQKPKWLMVSMPDSDSARVAECRKQTAEAVADLVLDYLEKTPDASCKDIIVLTRKNHDLDFILPALHDAEIPTLATGARTFYRHLEVLDLVNLLICLHHPEDTLAIAAVLRSPIVHLAYSDLDRLLQSIAAPRVFFGDEELPDYLPYTSAARIQEIRSLAASRHSDLLPVWIQKVYSFMPKSPYVDQTDHQGRSIARMLKILREFQRTCENLEIPPLVWLLKQRERAMKLDHWDTKLGEDVSISDESIDAVRVMTIHKAKGLEGRCVILFDWEEVLEEASADPRPEPVIRSRIGEDEIRGFSLPWASIQITSSFYAKAYAAEKAQTQQEARRLAYVAATRAREHLFILTNIDSSKGKSDFVQGCIERANPAVIERVEWVSQERRHRPPAWTHHIDQERYLACWKEREQQFHISSETRGLVSATALVRKEGEEKILASSREDERSSILRGKLVHLYLEKHLTEWGFSERSFESLLKVLDSPVDKTDRERASLLLRSFFGGKMKDSKGVPLLTRIQRSRLLGREVPFFLRRSDRTWTGVIDLILQEDCRIYAIDYKTSEKPETLPSSYAVQREVYLEALERLFPGQEVVFEFWWLGGDSLGKEELGQGRLPFQE